MAIPDPTYASGQNYEAQGAKSWVIQGTLDIASGGKITNGGTQSSLAATCSITDSTGGTPSTTFAAITAGGSYAQADMVAVKNALSQVAAALNAILAALQGVGVSS